MHNIVRRQGFSTSVLLALVLVFYLLLRIWRENILYPNSRPLNGRGYTDCPIVCWAACVGAPHLRVSQCVFTLRAPLTMEWIQSSRVSYRNWRKKLWKTVDGLYYYIL